MKINLTAGTAPLNYHCVERTHSFHEETQSSPVSLWTTVLLYVLIVVIKQFLVRCIESYICRKYYVSGVLIVVMKQYLVKGIESMYVANTTYLVDIEKRIARCVSRRTERGSALGHYTSYPDRFSLWRTQVQVGSGWDQVYITTAVFSCRAFFPQHGE